MITDTSGCHAILEALRDECCSEGKEMYVYIAQ